MFESYIYIYNFKEKDKSIRVAYKKGGGRREDPPVEGVGWRERGRREDPPVRVCTTCADDGKQSQ